MIEPFVGQGRDEVAADPQHRIAADFEVEVRRAALDRHLQKVVDVHPAALSALWSS